MSQKSIFIEVKDESNAIVAGITILRSPGKISFICEVFNSVNEVIRSINVVEREKTDFDGPKEISNLVGEFLYKVLTNNISLNTKYNELQDKTLFDYFNMHAQ